MKIGISLFLATFLVLIQSNEVARAQDTFTVAGFTFDQRYTPNQGTRLGNATNLSGALFSSGLVTATTVSPINFPPGASGFNTALSLAQVTGIKNGIYAINLPQGDNGVINRHGLEVWWSNNRGIGNLPGNDFVVYESASSIGAVEGVMVRVRTNQLANAWSGWYYFASTNFQITSSTNGVHSYGFDMSNMGVPANMMIDRIQLANLKQSDRIDAPGTLTNGNFVGQGRVVFDGSSSVFPDPGSYDANAIFDADQLDPDPLYLASLQSPCEMAQPVLGIANSGGNITLTWPAPSCFTPQFKTNLFDSWTAISGSILVTNGLNAMTFSSVDAACFFRLVK